ncbi:[Protein ADP-ribosylarginine] hydrolase [Exaiptasia diaphana]|nr:[Protein ADP-ribosylarginine] hydrolase [Exaiptasia diaphana]
MLLSAAGDALGYKNGEWEFCYQGRSIHDQLKAMGGLKDIKVNKKQWRVSDDTILHIATAEGLVSDWSSKEDLYLALADKYKSAMKDMWGRAPGATVQASCHSLKPNRPKGYVIPFDPRGGGCGACMRSMCIGLLFNKPEQLENLIEVSIESGRMTHNHPTGYLGSLAGALFTSYAIQKKPVREWGASLMSILPQALEYIKINGRDVGENKANWSYFTDKWSMFLKERGIQDGDKDPTFPSLYGVEQRDAFYRSVSWSGWGGSSGHDAPMIAYDAMLGAGGSWEELCDRAMFHGGDSDSTGVMAGAWWGAIYGLDNVPKGNYEHLEYKQRIEELAEKLYQKSEALSQ